MKDVLILLIITIFIIGAFFIPTLSYLVIYRRASKHWIKMKGLKTGEKAYPRSFGGIATVEYEVDKVKYNVEIYKANFSSIPYTDTIELMVNPNKPEICVQINSVQFTKNWLSLLILGTLLIVSIIFAFKEVLSLIF